MHPSSRRVAFTFDDLPKQGGQQDLSVTQNVARRLLTTLTAHKVPAIGFVNESKLYVEGEMDTRIEILRLWLRAGVPLGNHTFSHLSLHDTPLWKYEDDVIHGEVVTSRLMEAHGLRLRYLRHPYTRTGRTREVKEEFEAFLRQRGYTVAPFTVENADYAFNDVYVRALKQQDAALAQRIRAAYLGYSEVMFAYFERLSRELLGYEVPQIFLVHANEINADCLEEMIVRLKRRGYAFITLDQALADKAYQLKDGYIGRVGLSWLHRWAVGMGKPNTFREEPDPPRFIRDLYRAR